MQIGDDVGDFEASTHTGEKVRLDQMLEKGPVVLFFFPKAFTAG